MLSSVPRLSTKHEMDHGENLYVQKRATDLETGRSTTIDNIRIHKEATSHTKQLLCLLAWKFFESYLWLTINFFQ